MIPADAVILSAEVLWEGSFRDLGHAKVLAHDGYFGHINAMLLHN